MAPSAHQRFIPAWAGNTRSLTGRAARQPVHPRVGGEHSCSSWYLMTHSGSSPRGRGTRDRAPVAEARARFIPAWAGNTSMRKAIVYALSVHPRVGGEHGQSLVVVECLIGSSPRGRGTQTDSAQKFQPPSPVALTASNSRAAPRPIGGILTGHEPRGSRFQRETSGFRESFGINVLQVSYIGVSTPVAGRVARK